MGIKYTTTQKNRLRALGKKLGYKVTFEFNHAREYEGEFHNDLAIFSKHDKDYFLEKRTWTETFENSYSIFDRYSARTFNQAIIKARKILK